MSVLLILATMCVAVACDTQNRPNSTAAASISPTPAYSPTAELTPAMTPIGTPTPLLGMQPGCQIAGYYRYRFFSCWVGIVNGNYLSVGVGRDTTVPNATLQQIGVFIVYNGPYDVISDDNPDIYIIPNNFGSARITAVDGIRFTLAQTGFYGDPTPNGQTIIFDLATRQFITTSGTSIPATPVPTDTPTR